MSFEIWAAFAAASAILLIVPGPTILLVVSYALGQGWRLCGLRKARIRLAVVA